MHDHVFFASVSVASAGCRSGLAGEAACALGIPLLPLPHRRPRSLRAAPGHPWRLLCCGVAWAVLQAVVLYPSVPTSSSMTTPPAVAAAPALGRVMPPGPPENAALRAGPPVNGADGRLLAPAVSPAQSIVPPVSCPVTPSEKPAVTSNPAGGKVPLRLVQPRAMPAAPVETLVGKGVPAAPLQQLPKPSGVDVKLPAPLPAASKTPQTTIQLPASLQIPQGAVLVRSNTGQLMLLSQQALGQAQNNATVRWSIPTNSSTVKIQTVQNSGTQVVKVLAAPVKTVSGTTHSVTSTVKKPVTIQPVATTNSIATHATGTPLVTGPSAKTLASDSSTLTVIPKPVPDTEDTTIDQTSVSTDMLENVKKCKNFLATLIKLACSGPQAPEMGQNVKNLVQSLLDAKMEPEEFTKKLYIELKSSPQPNLVPFLKKSVFALRQLMPNTETFIQQCLQQSVPQTAASTTAMSTTSIVANSSSVTTTSLLSARPVSRTPVGIVSPQTGTVSCTSSTRESGSLPLIQPVHAVSIQGASANTSTQLTLGISTVKAVCPTSSSPMVTTGTTALQGVKPVHIPAASSATLVACSSVKSVSSSAMTTSLPLAKPASTTASATLAKAVKASVQTGMPVTGAPITIRVAHPNSFLSQPVRTSQAIKIVQQPPGSILKKVTTLQPASALPVVSKLDGKMPLNAFIQTSQLPSGSIVKQITLPGNKILSLQASPVQRNKIRENGTTSFRDEDDINDVTSMAGVNLSEESACILAANSGTAGSIIRSCPEELLLALDVLKKKILEIGKRHDITEVNSDVLNLVSHAMQERLRGLLEKLTIIAQHRLMTYKGNDNYTMCSDTQAHLKFFEQLDHVEKQRKNEEEREMLLRAAKSRSNKEDPEQLRLKQKAKEMQQLELAQIQQMEANRAALAAIGPRKKRPLDSPNLVPGVEGLNRSPSLAKPYLRPRIIRICLRDLIFCMEQEREMKHSLALYQALLK